MKGDFSAYARLVASSHGLGQMLPVVEKELIHYDILRALDETGWLDRLTFQGGTCLRLCYGGVRFSEDLDFNVREDLTAIDLTGFAAALSSALESKFDVGVRVKEPTSVKAFEGGGELKRWQVVVDTAPARADLPSQKIKIEIAHIPAYTRSPRLLNVNYPELPGSLGGILVNCQSMEEILADKIVSFANAREHPRYRDLWDIPWIASRGAVDLDEVARMVRAKHADYGCTSRLLPLLEDGCRRAESLAASGEFRTQMRRFVPQASYDATLGRPGYAEALAGNIGELYRQVEKRIAGE